MFADFETRYAVLKVECSALGMQAPVAKPSDEGIPTLWIGTQCVGAFIPADVSVGLTVAGAHSDVSGEAIKAGWFIFGHSCPDEKSAAAEIRARTPQ